jgi:hypothetical protein
MATTLSQMTVAAHLTARLTKTEQGSTVQTDANALKFSLALTAGTTADKADLFYQETDKALTSASTHDLDIYDMAIFDATTDLLGNAVVNVEVVAIIVRNQAASVGTLLLGNNGTTAAWNSMFGGSDDTGFLSIPPGGFFMLAAPVNPAYAVADTTNHLLRVTASGGNITYDIGILSRSA